jgi:glutathione S-transferase
MQLFGNRESGHSYKVSLMMWLADISHSYTEIDIALPREARPEPFRTHAPYGEVPLLLHGGRAYAQSNALLLYLAEHSRRFGGESPQRMARVREWLFWEANRIGFSLPNLRYGLRFAEAGLAPDVEAMLRARLDADLARLCAELADGRDFMLDDGASVVDIALCAYLFWADQAGVAVPPILQAWLERIRALPGWRHPYDARD